MKIMRVFDGTHWQLFLTTGTGKNLLFVMDTEQQLDALVDALKGCHIHVDVNGEWK